MLCVLKIARRIIQLSAFDGGSIRFGLKRAVIVATLALAPHCKAGELRVLTSMPDDIYQPFFDAFGALSPGDTISVLNKDTNASIEEIAQGNPRKFDVFWASSEEAFDVIAGFDGFAPPLGAGDAPSPGGLAYRAFALASVGWCWRPDLNDAPPGRWEDLLAPRYTDRIALARPSRSGTAHMFVERTLQVHGWEKGWAYLLELAGNLSTVTGRSFNVPDGVISGRFDIGITIDYLALSAGGGTLAFDHGVPLLISESRIGVLRGGGNPELAHRFSDFVISDAGQRLLLLPRLRRVPVSPRIRAEMPDARIAAAFDDARAPKTMRYQSVLASERYWAVNALFDEFITLPLEEWKALWRRYRALAARPGDAALASLDGVRQLLLRMPITEVEAEADEVNRRPGRDSRLTALTEAQKEVAAKWRRVAEDGRRAIDAALAVLERGPENVRP